LNDVLDDLKDIRIERLEREIVEKDEEIARLMEQLGIQE
jgi:hypothetical protein